MQVYESLFDDATEERIDQIFGWLDESNSGYVDYLEYSRRLKLDVVPELVKHCKTQGPLFQSSLTPDELRQLRRMMRRLHDLADAATKVFSLQMTHKVGSKMILVFWKLCLKVRSFNPNLWKSEHSMQILQCLELFTIIHDYDCVWDFWSTTRGFFWKNWILAALLANTCQKEIGNRDFFGLSKFLYIFMCWLVPLSFKFIDLLTKHEFRFQKNNVLNTSVMCFLCTQ